jgi:hypothetical protein
MTGAWGVSSAGGYPHTINWFEWWDIENDDGDDVGSDSKKDSIKRQPTNSIEIH